MPRIQIFDAAQPKRRRGRPPKQVALSAQPKTHQHEPKREPGPTEENLPSMSIMPKLVRDVPKLDILQSQMYQETASAHLIPIFSEHPELKSPDWIGEELRQPKSTRSMMPTRKLRIEKSVRFADESAVSSPSSSSSTATVEDALTTPVHSILRKSQSRNTTKKTTKRNNTSSKVSADASAERPTPLVTLQKPGSTKKTKSPTVSKRNGVPSPRSAIATDTSVERTTSSVRLGRPPKRRTSVERKQHQSPSVATTDSPVSSTSSLPMQPDLPKRNLLPPSAGHEEEVLQLANQMLSSIAAPLCGRSGSPKPTRTHQKPVEPKLNEQVDAGEDSSSSSDTTAEPPASPIPSSGRVPLKEQCLIAHIDPDVSKEAQATSPVAKKRGPKPKKKILTTKPSDDSHPPPYTPEPVSPPSDSQCTRDNDDDRTTTDPTNLGVLPRHQEVQTLLNDSARALRRMDYVQLLELMENATVGALELSVMQLIRLFKYEEAIQACKRHQATHPTSPAGYLWSGTVWEARCDYKHAADAYRAGVEATKDSVLAERLAAATARCDTKLDPLLHLPTQALQSVFMYVPEQRWTALRVSHHWQTTLTGLPALWKDLRLNLADQPTYGFWEDGVVRVLHRDLSRLQITTRSDPSHVLSMLRRRSCSRLQSLEIKDATLYNPDTVGGKQYLGRAFYDDLGAVGKHLKILRIESTLAPGERISAFLALCPDLKLLSYLTSSSHQAWHVPHAMPAYHSIKALQLPYSDDLSQFGFSPQNVPFLRALHMVLPKASGFTTDASQLVSRLYRSTTNIKHLSFSSNPLPDDALDALLQNQASDDVLGLQTLTLDAALQLDAALLHKLLSESSETLEDLDCRCALLNMDGMQQYVLPRLKTLRFNAQALSMISLVDLLRNSRDLTDVHLEAIPLSRGVLDALAHLPLLRSLTLDHCWCESDGLLAQCIETFAAKENPSLASLSCMSPGARVLWDEETLVTAGSVPTLKHLALARPDYTSLSMDSVTRFLDRLQDSGASSRLTTLCLPMVPHHCDSVRTKINDSCRALTSLQITPMYQSEKQKSALLFAKHFFPHPLSPILSLSPVTHPSLKFPASYWNTDASQNPSA
ncbi:hypothetical protein BCR43DRAFT_562365 [Syncephalastrum racemosum]|uniref:F-box domain-containing protein n=1 Tax=Syncephalastrum racemosum TaxID=13706 RepID=A0A1X2HIT0_SYNRA|nr:hypothetical protein BCR43DRAFT_562365 [Syncephalastrum racemosum]